MPLICQPGKLKGLQTNASATILYNNLKHNAAEIYFMKAKWDDAKKSSWSRKPLFLVKLLDTCYLMIIKIYLITSFIQIFSTYKIACLEFSVKTN